MPGELSCPEWGLARRGCVVAPTLAVEFDGGWRRGDTVTRKPRDDLPDVVNTGIPSFRSGRENGRGMCDRNARMVFVGRMHQPVS